MNGNENILSERVRGLILDPGTLIALSTLNERGVPQVDFISGLVVSEDNQLEHLEYSENSRTHLRLVNALWFGHSVSITLRGKDGEVFEIQGYPRKVHVTGALFSRRYAEVLKEGRSEGLAGVWRIAPEAVTERSSHALDREHRRDEPFHLHLDAFALP